ncbi:MAG: pirin family protein [Xanthomonadaceae bacterium]|nr:pirin family protein [Xanthomonadaceae bacterium]
MEHRDSEGLRDRLDAGDAQWIRAGRGMLHAEHADRRTPRPAIVDQSAAVDEVRRNRLRLVPRRRHSGNQTAECRHSSARGKGRQRYRTDAERDADRFRICPAGGGSRGRSRYRS